jgi:hypothetical protein
VIISERAVHQDEDTPGKITGANVESTTLTEGKVTYDIIFTAVIPGTKDRIHMYINVEAQNDYDPGYPLTKRGIYYCCRIISSQYEREFTKSHYENLKKVCSIWICTNPPKEKYNTITEYSIHEKTVVGNSTELKENYDLIKCIMICLGDADDTEGVLRLLDTLMHSDFGAEKKKTIMEKDFGIEMTEEFDREVIEMCNYSKGVEQRGIEKGRAEGRADGRAEGTIEAYKEVGLSFLEAVKRIAEKFGLTEESSRMEVEKYW